MSTKGLHLSASKSLSLAAAKPLQPNELSQSFTPDMNDSYSPKSGGSGGGGGSKSHTPIPTTPRSMQNSNAADHIKVVCRFRPKNSRERAEEKRQNLSSNFDGREIEVYGDGRSLCIPRGKKKPALNYTLDGVIWSDKNQEETFISLAKSAVDSVVEGYNCTIFAFGQTGSGKTYTMFGPESLGKVEELGIIPRCVDYMFKLLDSGQNLMKYSISLSICEVYKEMLRDLLIGNHLKTKNRKRLEILSAGKGGIRVKNLTEKSCDSVSDILKSIVLAQSNRAKHTTDFIGHDSSRSHCVVMISLTQRLLDDSIKFSKLNFGDLAGSELASKTGTKGTNLKEAGKIHQGLLALENVINALVEKKKHVPYNDSKLTRLLSSSIGGNAKTTLLVTCSPSIWNRDETISTLRFAKRAKKIKNIAHINKRKTREQLESRIAKLERENKDLRQKLNHRKFGSKVVTRSANSKECKDTLIAKDNEINECLDEIIKLKHVVSLKEDQLTQCEEDLQSKTEIVSAFESSQREYEAAMARLHKKLADADMEVTMLRSKLDTKNEMEASLASHRDNLRAIVNNESGTMIAALQEITAQQSDFFTFLKTMSDGIEKIHEKQHETEKDINHRFDSMTETIKAIEINHHDTAAADDPTHSEERRGHFPQSSGSLLMFDTGDLSNLTGDSAHSRGVSLMSSVSHAMSSNNNNNNGEFDPMHELISSMRSYLDSADDHSNANSNPMHVAKKKQDNLNNINVGPYSVGNAVDVLDVSYVWYGASILDVDAFDKRAVYVSYDEFDDAWNEWIPMNKKYRIAPARSRVMDVISIHPSLRTQHGGVHCLCATKYGRSANAQDLQNVFSAQNYDNERLSQKGKAILIQGHLYKQASWSKKTWKRRWFVVRNAEPILIYYYDHRNMKSKQYRGCISLNQIAVIQMAKSKGYTKYSFDIITLRNKKHRFSANNEEDLTDWLSVLECLVYSDCQQIKEEKKKIIKLDGDDDDDEKEQRQQKRPSSPLVRNISAFFSGSSSPKPTTPRKTYSATYQFVDD